MARPFKWRRIENIPSVFHFAPVSEASDKPHNKLLYEEIEAIRLKDLEGLEQQECADKMQVSRPTFQRILLSARQKIADSIINGKGINIEGGNFTRNICSLKCFDCKNIWNDTFENIQPLKNQKCPECGSDNIVCVQNCQGHCKGHCRRRRGV